jgi:hypothetical protein
MSQSKLYDETLPEELRAIQTWFGKTISRPLSKDDGILPRTAAGKSIVHEASRYIAKSPTLAPHQRIEIYNQQYWWRLFKALHEACPILIRLFGYYAFNEQIAKPYLLAYPPSSWSLFAIADDLPTWLKKNYRDKDRKLVIEAAEIEEAYNRAFIAKHRKNFIDASISPEENAAKLFQENVALQGHVSLFAWQWDYIPFREAFLAKEPEYWIDNPFPPLEKSGPYCYIIYRNKSQMISAEQLSAAEHLVLSLFKQEKSVADVCEELEQRTLSEEVFAAIESNLSLWIQKWFAKAWIYTEAPFN